MAMKTELAPVAARDLQIIEYRGQRVVTTEQLAAGYGATEKMISNNYLATNPASLKVNITSRLRVKSCGVEEQTLFKWVSWKECPLSDFWTERGAANHAKMLETDQAWNYFNDLTEFYFSYGGNLSAAPTELSKLEILKMAIESEEGDWQKKNAQIMPKEPKPRLAANAKPQLSESSAPQHDAAGIWKNNSVKAKNTQPLPK
jgi:hypothetical protein